MSTSDYIGPDDVHELTLQGSYTTKDIALQCATAVFCAHISGPHPMMNKPDAVTADDIIALADRLERWLAD